MGMIKRWSGWWSRFLDLPQDSFRQAINILQQRYVEKTQQRYKREIEISRSC